MKIHLVTAEHLTVPGQIQKAFADRSGATREAVSLVNRMLIDTGLQPLASTLQWGHHLGRLQEQHGAAHCYVEITEIDVDGVPDGSERATLEEIDAARIEYGNDDIQIDDDAAVSRADNGAWVSAWVWVPNNDGEE